MRRDLISFNPLLTEQDLSQNRTDCERQPELFGQFLQQCLNRLMQDSCIQVFQACPLSDTRDKRVQVKRTL